MITDRQTHTHRQTDMLITILRSPNGGEVIMEYTGMQLMSMPVRYLDFPVYVPVPVRVFGILIKFSISFKTIVLV